MLYWPAGAALPPAVLPFQLKLVRPEDAGGTLKVSISDPALLVTDTVRLLAPVGATTAPDTEPPDARLAVLPGASTLWPRSEVPDSTCEACSPEASPEIEVCRLCRLDTSESPSICARNCVGSVGFSGSWFCICVLISCRKPAWLMFMFAGTPPTAPALPVAALAGVVRVEPIGRVEADICNP